MPDGVMKWFDPSTGEAEITRGGRLFPARSSDIESVARRAGARVHFDVRRVDGVDRAVGVRLREGTRVSHHHRRFGTLVGARWIDTKGPAPHAEAHPELRADGAHPLQVARSWATCVARGDAPGMLALYAPGAVVHVDGESLSGRLLRAWLEASPLFGCGRHARVRGGEGTADVSWGVGTADEPGATVRSRIDHGRIAEQWVSGPEPAGPAPGGPPGLAVSTTGEVGEEVKDRAREAVRGVVGMVGEPVLSARVKLTWEPDPARPRPAIAQAALDVNGDLVRAESASRSMAEAIDLLVVRLHDQLEHRARRREHLHRREATHPPGEWQHGDLPTSRPPYFDRPVEDRRLVAHKTFAVNEITPDEAAFDMEQLDYDFYLFCDLASGADSVIERADGGYRLTRIGVAAEIGPTAAPVEVSDVSPPLLGLNQAVERLNAGGEDHLFFANVTTGRGNVLYRRYDGHYGLMTPD